MKMKKRATLTPKAIFVLLLVTLSIAVSVPAWAAPFSVSFLDFGPLDGGSVSYNFTAPGASAPGGATLVFDLVGYGSVDGANCCTDTFSLTINGDLMFSGGFDMGGGGSQFINYIDPGVNILSTISYGWFGGGLTQFVVTHTLLSGSNTYVFDYGSMQGIGDEGWGLSGAHTIAEVNVSNVPEPSTLLLLGSGLAGLALARRRLKFRG